MAKYSVIIPVYNRPEEIDELLHSLTKQTCPCFDVVIVEDGSSIDCKHIIDQYLDVLDISYFYKHNTGPGDSRNYGMAKANGEYLIFFDSDCIVPQHYFEHVEQALSERVLDCFGGPDSADHSFTPIQKAINYAMTSLVTTGGIRGKENSLDTYQPRSFNMGIKRNIFKTIGGFSDIHPGEDPDFSYRIMNQGYSVGLIPTAHVYHKRRVSFPKFITQVYKFGIVRPILIKWYPSQFKLTYLLPSLFLLGSLTLVALATTVSTLFYTPLLLITLIITLESFIKTKSITICLLSILASYIQLFSYGYGFLISAFQILLLRKDERQTFPQFFFTQ